MVKRLGVLAVLLLILTIVEIVFKPWMPGFLGSGYEWFWFLCFFTFGYLRMMAKEGYYRLLEERFRPSCRHDSSLYACILVVTSSATCR